MSRSFIWGAPWARFLRLRAVQAVLLVTLGEIRLTEASCSTPADITTIQCTSTSDSSATLVSYNASGNSLTTFPLNIFAGRNADCLFSDGAYQPVGM